MTFYTGEEPREHRRFITELYYCKVDDALPNFPHHPQAVLALSEVVAIGVLYAMKNVSRRAFYDWLNENYGRLFSQLPHRTRLFRRLETQACWPSLLSWAWATAMASSCVIQYGNAAEPIRSVERESPTIAGS